MTGLKFYLTTFQMTRTETNRNKQEQTGTNMNKQEQTGTTRNKQEQTGTNRNKQKTTYLYKCDHRQTSPCLQGSCNSRNLECCGNRANTSLVNTRSHLKKGDVLESYKYLL